MPALPREGPTHRPVFHGLVAARLCVVQKRRSKGQTPIGDSTTDAVRCPAEYCATGSRFIAKSPRRKGVVLRVAGSQPASDGWASESVCHGARCGAAGADWCSHSTERACLSKAFQRLS